MPETPQIWIALSREEAWELRAFALEAGVLNLPEISFGRLAFELLIAALNSEQGRTAYRVVVTEDDGPGSVSLTFRTIEQAESRVRRERRRHPAEHVRIQSRQVLETDWVDVEGAAGE